MRTNSAALAWISTFLLIASIGHAAQPSSLPSDEIERCRASGWIHCHGAVANVAQAGGPVAISLIDTLPPAQKESVSALYKLITDPSGGDGTPVEKRKGDVAERITQFIWEDYTQSRKVPAALSGTGKDENVAGISEFIGTPVALKNVQMKGAVRMGDKNYVNDWVTFAGKDQATSQERWTRAAILFYAIGACPRSNADCTPPSWVDNDLAGKLKASAHGYRHRLFEALKRWTSPGPGEDAATQPERPAGLPEPEMSRRAYPIDAPWLSKFLTDAADQAQKLIVADKEGPAAAQRLQFTPWRTTVPAGTAPIRPGQQAPAPGPNTWTVNRMEAMEACEPGVRDCGGKMAYLYQENGVWHRLSIRLVRVRDDDHVERDYIQVIDMVPYAPNTNRYHLIPVGQPVDQWDFPSGTPGKVHRYRFELRTDGANQWIMITGGDGNGEVSMAPGAGDDSFGVVSMSGDDAETQQCKQLKSQGKVDNRKCLYGLKVQGLINARARQCQIGGRQVHMGSYDYCVVTQLAPRLCYQFFRLEGGTPASDCSMPGKCGVACVAQKVEGSGYTEIPKNKGLYLIGNFEGTNWCLKPKPNVDFLKDWDLDHSDSCKSDVDAPLNPPPPPKDPKDPKEEKTAPTVTGPTPGQPPPPEQKGDLTPEKYLELLKANNADLGKDSGGKYDIAYFTKGKNGNALYFFFLYPGYKVAQFNGTLVCNWDTDCIKQEGDELLIVTATIQDGKWNGESIRWLDFKDRDKEGALKSPTSGKYYPVKNLQLYRLSISGLQALKSNDSKPAPAVKLSTVVEVQNPPSDKDRSTGEYSVYVQWEDWQKRFEAFCDRYAKDSPIFGPAQAANKALVIKYIAQERAVSQQHKTDNWEPFVQIFLYQPKEMRGQVPQDLVVFNGLGESGDGQHQCKLQWKYAGGKGQIVASPEGCVK